jgi:predicted acylesterase/phospholipase RssA
MNRSPVPIDLALQGGGSHGAFTWGVLDRLLEEPWLRIAGISGTSAGAMNAAVLADGWVQGEADGARAALLRMIALLRQVADPGSGEGARWAQMRTHRIMTDMLAQFGASSKLNAEWAFIAMPRTEGRRAASEFLDASGNDLGKRSTADLDVLLAEC